MNRFIPLVVLAVFFAGCGKEPVSIINDGVAKPQKEESRLPASPVKGTHVSAWVAGTDWWWTDLVRLTNRTELNALVIDCKDESGYVSWNSKVKLAQESGASSGARRAI